MEIYYINYYRDSGYNVLNTLKGGGLGGTIKKILTYDECKKEIKKYKSRTELHSNKIIYSMCKIFGLIDEFFPKIKYTYEICKNESKKYNNLSDFRKSSQNFYRNCLKNNWLDEFFPKNS